MSDACRCVRAVWWGAQGVLCALILPVGAVDISRAREVVPPPGDRGELLHEIPITSAPVPKLAPMVMPKERDPLPAVSPAVNPAAPAAAVVQKPRRTVKPAPSMQAGPTPRTQSPAMAKNEVRTREIRASKVNVAKRPSASKRASASTSAPTPGTAKTATAKRANPSAKAFERAAAKATDRSQAVTRRKANVQAAASPASKAGSKAGTKVLVKAPAKPSATASRKVNPTVPRGASGKSVAPSARRSAVQKVPPASSQVVKSKKAAQRR